jgi:ABC-type sugar transport system permease subunit
MMPPFSRFGYACAQGISVGLVLVALSFIQYRFLSMRRDSAWADQ